MKVAHSASKLALRRTERFMTPEHFIRSDLLLLVKREPWVAKGKEMVTQKKAELSFGERVYLFSATVSVACAVVALAGMLAHWLHWHVLQGEVYVFLMLILWGWAGAFSIYPIVA
jgi:hypothetical protein